MEEKINTQPYDDEITLRELILRIREYWREIWRNWWLIGLIAIPFVGYFLYKTFTHVPEYKAEIRFLVEGQGGSSVGSLGGLLGSFGFSSSGASNSNPYKILEVAKSKRMIGEVLLEKSISNDQLIANNIIDLYELTEKWKKNNPEMEDIMLRDIDINEFSKNERKAFLSLYGKTVGSKENREKALLKIGLDEDSGIFSILSNTKDEPLSLDLANKLYQKVKYFFEKQILEDQISTRDILMRKADSLNAVIDTKLREIARFEDSSRGLVSRESEITKEKMLLEVEGNTSAYVELQKSLQIADYELQNMKPQFMVIDQPYNPIKPTQESILLNLILGCLLGGFIGMGFIIARKIYQDAMEEE